MIHRAAKRCMDVLGAALLLVLGAPLLAAVAAYVRFTMGAPVLFQQPRAGLRGRPFRLHKFRTMHVGQDANGRDLPDAARLSPAGAGLRASSLDELPQLWNVLRGEMSLVGPRPLPLDYLDRYSARQMRRHDVRPGITGWAQIHGRNALSWERRFELDLWYVEHASLLLDLRILLRTMLIVLTRAGINAEGEATMKEFVGQ